MLLREIDKLKGKKKTPKAVDGADGEASNDSEKSDTTIPYNEWNCKTINWDAFSDVSSQPSTSRVDKGKQTEDEEDEGSEY